MNEKKFLDNTMGGRILLGALCLSTSLAFGSLVYYFISSGEKNIFHFVLYELSFLLTVLSLLGLTWAIATPQFLEKIIYDNSKKALFIAAIVLIATALFFIYMVIQ